VDISAPLIGVIVAVVLSALLPQILKARRRRKPQDPAPAATPLPVPANTPEPPAAEVTALAEPPAPPPEPLAVVLLRIGAKLENVADRSTHPRELSDWPEFQAVVEAFRRPDVTIDALRQYALGANWPLTCAAFAALAEHGERASLFNAVLTDLGKIRPWTIYFALEYFCSLESRPSVGAAVLAAQKWWPDNLVIPGIFRDYFARRQALGDDPAFGDWLESWLRFYPDFVQSLLERVDHPFAGELLGQFKTWRASRTDLQFLSSFGCIWGPGEEDKLLVEPAAWQDALKTASDALHQKPPRSLAVSGESRIGKTAFLRLLALRLKGAGWRIFEASGAELQSGQVYIGQLEERIRQLVAELDAGKRVAWYVNDLLQLAESGTHKGQSASILDQILPALSAGRLVLLSESSPSGLSRLFQMRPSIRSLIEVCRLHPMSESEAGALAADVARRIQAQHGLTLAPETLPTALQLAQQYLGSGQLPGSLLDLLRRSAMHSTAAGDKMLDASGVIATLSQITGLPRSILDDKERIDLTATRQYLAGRVMGQSEAVNAVVDRVAMLKAGLVDPNRPVAVFLFAGPTGTGKTELAKTLAQFLFGSPERMARLDMSELQSAEATSKIMGMRGYMPPDSLVERIRKQPFSVILLDEFEKAHANVWDLFLQIFDDGRLSDANGGVVDFRHCFIILTSNLGATSHRGAGMGFVPEVGAYSEDQVLRAVGQTFRPEFINRLDKIIVFRPLSREMMRDILRLELSRLSQRRGLRRRDWAVEWESSAIEFLLDRGFSPEMGARPLRRAIDQYLLAPLAAALVEHRFPEGDQFLFVRSNGKAIEVEFVDPDGGAPAAEAAGEPEGQAEATTSLAAMILRPRGSAEELAVLWAAATAVQGRLAAADWAALRERLVAESTETGIWSRPDRHAVFARRALIDRVEEAARTAERLKMRLESSSTRPGSASRELVGRLALQLHLVEQGIADLLAGSPVDILLSVEPVLDGAADASTQAAWCNRLMQMYRHWAERRHMQLDEHGAPKKDGAPVLQFAGFGAFRRLESEIGLHVLETAEGGPRFIARVKAVAGPWEEPKPGTAYRSLAGLLAMAGESNTVVRRYREKPAPLVRDVKDGWRSGRLDAVLAGDFDLIGEAQR
jgi:ATP-dependent Clp protease ATP-binding subunit ClpC